MIDTQIVARIRMVSGVEYQCSAILMFDIARIREAEGWKTKIEQSLGGFRTGLGFIGSFSYVVSRALVLGLVENTVSQHMSTQAFSNLEAYYQACIRLRNSGTFIELNQIEGIKIPIPQSWRVITGKNPNGPTGYLLYEDPCVAVKTSAGIISIMWDKVESYIVDAIPVDAQSSI